MSAARPRFNPFPGLRPFQSEDKHVFFGRETQTMELLARLGRTRFLAAVGVSGSGKSSLIRAGLLPELYGGTMTRAGSRWEVALLRPGGEPIASLATALSQSGLYDPDLEDCVAQIEVTLRRSALGLVEAARQSGLPAKTNLLVVVDQFEELFRFRRKREGQGADAEAFVSLLLEAVHQEACPIYVVLTMRSDFLGDCAQFRGLAEAINEGQYLIPRLNRDQWKAAIEGPVKVGGGQISSRLVQRLLNDAAEDPDQLPILQHALMRTWEAWIKDRTADEPIDLRHYEAIGAVKEALSRHADEIYDALPDDRHRRVAEKTFKALAETGRDARGTRRPARFAELQAVTEAAASEVGPVIEAFRQPGRTFLMPGADVALTGDTIIDISHESLMRIWRRMRSWVEEEAASARTYRRLAETASLWKEGTAGLYRDPDLQIAVRWREKAQPTAAWAERYHSGFAQAIEFLEKSQQEDQAEKQAKADAARRELEQTRALAEAQRILAEEKTREARRMRWLSRALVVLALLMVLAAVFAWREKRRAGERERIAFSREIASHASAALDIDPERGLLLAIEAATLSAKVKPTEQAWDVLRQCLFESDLRLVLQRGTNSLDSHTHLIGHTEMGTTAAFSPDGRLVFSGGDDGAVQVWDAQSGKMLAMLKGNTPAFSPAGPLIVTAQGPRAWVWQTNDWSLASEFTGSRSNINSAAFSPDGALVVTAGQDGAAQVWEARTGRVLHQWTEPEGALLGALFNPAGRSVLTVSATGSVRLWDMDTGQSRYQLEEAGQPTRAIFSPDGKSIVTFGRDELALLWRTGTGKLVRRLEGHTLPVLSAEFRADGHRLVTASEDSQAIIWSVPDGKKMVMLNDHPEAVSSAAFSPAEEILLTGSHDKTARLWSGKDGHNTLILRGHTGPINSAAFSPDGESVLTSAADQTVRVWSPRLGRGVLSLPKHAALLNLSPDGQTVAWTTATNTWLVQTRGRPPAPHLSKAGAVHAVSFSADGRLMATVADGANSPVQVWDVHAETEEPLWRPLITNAVRGASLSPSGRFMATWSDVQGQAAYAIQVWDLQAKRLAATLRDDRSSPASDYSSLHAAFSRDEKLLATVNKEWSDAANVAGAPSRLRIWNIHDGSLVTSRERPRDWFHDVAFSPDGQLVVTASELGIALLWHLQSPGVTQLDGHAGPVNTAAFNPDGRFIVTASSDRTVRVWSASSGRSLVALQGHNAPVASAVFAADGRSIVSVSVGEGGMARIHPCDECDSDHEVLQLARRRVSRALTEPEREKYLHQIHRQTE